MKYCIREDIPHVVFRDFNEVLALTQKVVSGEKTTQQVIAEGNDN